MKIIRLTIKNFLKLKDVSINPEKVNVFVGKNKQGKTSILKAIETAFGGVSSKTPVRNGEEEAEISIDLEDFKIHRTISKDGESQLAVANLDGFTKPSPQKFLNGLIGHFSFNPIEFFNLKSAEKKKYLLEAIPIKATKEMIEEAVGEKIDMNLDRHGLEVVSELHKHYYAQRTQANASVKELESVLNDFNLRIPSDFNKESFSEDRVKELRNAITENVNAKTVKSNCERNIEEGKARIAKWEEEIANEKAKISGFESQIATLEVKDTSALEKDLSELESKREMVSLCERRDEVQKNLETKSVEQERLDGIVKRLAKDVPEKMIATANFPIEGLKIGDDVMTLNGVDIDELSASEQLQFALEIVKQLNGEFKIICIDGVECLDKETFEWFLAHIEEDEFQYFITRVDGEGGYLISDGTISKNEIAPGSAQAV